MKKRLDSTIDNKSMKLSNHLVKSLINEISDDIQLCSEQFVQLIDSSPLFDFVRKREHFYLENMDSYYSFKCDDHQSGYPRTVGERSPKRRIKDRFGVFEITYDRAADSITKTRVAGRREAE